MRPQQSHREEKQKHREREREREKGKNDLSSRPLVPTVRRYREVPKRLGVQQRQLVGRTRSNVGGG